MSNQTPDRAHASGTFVPVLAPPFTTPVLNSKGINSFVRNSAGNYTVGLTNPLAFAEGNAEAQLPANFLGIAGATIAPDAKTVLVTVFDLSGVPADPPTFGLQVRSIEEGEGDGPEPVLPVPPTPGVGSGLLLGWGLTDAGGNLVDDSGAVDSVVGAGLGIFTWTLVAGLAALKAGIVQIQSGATNATQAAVTSDTVLTANTGPSSLAHWAFFYRGA